MSKAYKSYVGEVKTKISASKGKKALEAAIHVRNKTVEKLNKKGTGRRYLVPGTENTYYTASSPGEPPAVLFGDLKKSIKFQAEGGSATVGSELKKAPELEFGNPKKRLAARPFLKPTFQEEEETIIKILGKEWL